MTFDLDNWHIFSVRCDKMADVTSTVDFLANLAVKIYCITEVIFTKTTLVIIILRTR